MIDFDSHTRRFGHNFNLYAQFRLKSILFVLTRQYTSSKINLPWHERSFIAIAQHFPIHSVHSLLEERA